MDKEIKFTLGAFFKTIFGEVNKISNCEFVREGTEVRFTEVEPVTNPSDGVTNNSSIK